MNGKDNLFITFIIISKHSLISIHQVQIATADIILYVNQRILCCPGISFSPVTMGTPQIYIRFQHQCGSL